MDRQLLRQTISVMKTSSRQNRELKCQNELFLKYNFSGNTGLHVFIAEKDYVRHGKVENYGRESLLDV